MQLHGVMATPLQRMNAASMSDADEMDGTADDAIIQADSIQDKAIPETVFDTHPDPSTKNTLSQSSLFPSPHSLPNPATHNVP